MASLRSAGKRRYSGQALNHIDVPEPRRNREVASRVSGGPNSVVQGALRIEEQPGIERDEDIEQTVDVLAVRCRHQIQVLGRPDDNVSRHCDLRDDDEVNLTIDQPLTRPERSKTIRLAAGRPGGSP